MDVLRPPLIRIGGRCYRKNPIEYGGREDFHEEEDYTQNELTVYGDEACDADLLNIEQTDSGYKFKYPLPSAYFKYIIGKKAETKRKLENETRTQIRIPRPGEEGDIVIIGRDRSGVVSAKSRIDIIVDSARQKQPFTHFLSIPVLATCVETKFAEFKDDVLRHCDADRGIDQTIFQNPKKLHLTLGTLALLNRAEIQKAVEILKSSQEDIVRPILHRDALPVRIQGLEYMNDDPGEVDVLYAQVQDPSERLQQLADRLVDRFTAEGLMQRDYDRVKLHITVMNTLFRRDPSGAGLPTQRGGGKGRGGGAKERESFDATNVLKKFRNYDFSAYEIETVHLSERYSTGPDGYYACTDSINLAS